MANGFTQTRLSAAIPEIAGSLSQRWQSYKVYRSTLNELRSLSTAELNDLGLNPSMLRRLALEASHKV